jgi:hypothetical protein
MNPSVEVCGKVPVTLPLTVGTKIIAVRNIGPVREGAPGIITGIAEVPFFFRSRPVYLCTFAGNLKLAARPKEIDDYEHGYTLERVENPRGLWAQP